MSATAPSIRRVSIEESALLARVARATFVETFGPLYPPEDLEEYLAKSYTAERYRGKLEAPDASAWFATLPGEPEPIGFVLAGPCKLPVQDLEPRAGEIQQLYVFARHHNGGVGSRLLETALGFLEDAGRSPIYVGVWSENAGAQRLYARARFQKCGEYGFPVGKTVDREFILKR